jgi:YhcH/YjgK/YiaL family protein
MIIDSLKNSARYEQLNPRFKQAFDFLRKNDLSGLEAGKVFLEENNLYVMINDTKLKNKPDAKLEVHDKYIDIQVPVSVAESFGWKDRATCKDLTSPYNPEKDIAFYGDVPTTYFTLQPQEFVIFFPEDGHAPCVGSGDIRKVIVKVICE